MNNYNYLQLTPYGQKKALAQDRKIKYEAITIKTTIKYRSYKNAVN